MPRPKIQIDEKLLRSAINSCETTKKYSSRSELFSDVSEKYNKEANGLALINPQLVYLRINELNIDLVTPKGKKGRAAGFKPTGIRVGRGVRIAADEQAKRSLDVIRGELNRGMQRDPNDKPGAIFLPLVDKMEQGSIKAAVKMMCLQCSNFQKEEIKNCACIGCALYHIRPYRAKENVSAS